MHCLERHIRRDFAPLLSLHPGSSLDVRLRRLSGPDRWRIRVRFRSPDEAVAALQATYVAAIQQQQGD